MIVSRDERRQIMLDVELGTGAFDVDWRMPPVSLDRATMAFDPVITCKGNDIRIVLIEFTPRRCGQFAALVARIIGAGFRPVVVCPVLADMPAVLAHWQWRRRIEGISLLEEWVPPPGFRA